MNTNKLKPFMHGYLMNYRHYSKLKATVSKPELDEFLRNARRDRIEKKLSERINTQRKQYKVGNNLHYFG